MHPLLARLVAEESSLDSVVKRLVTTLDEDEQRFLAHLSDVIERLVGHRLTEVLQGYRWFAEMLREEELFFFRNGRYRHTSSTEVASLYADPVSMARYMDGLLLSHVLWPHHLRRHQDYVDGFLPTLTPGSRLLEIGPGHGLLLHAAASRSEVVHVEGWEISPAALAATREALEQLGAPSVRLELRDASVLPDTPGRFDAIVISELLEHLEEPAAMLRSLPLHLAPGGRLFVTVPVNSPVVDHLVLLRTPAEARALLEDSGLQILQEAYHLPAGYSMERAARNKAPISCVFTAVPT